MSVIPVVRQIRRQVTLADGSVRFEVASEVVDRGDLPFPHLFVVTISSSVDPKDDVLARVATPVDLRRADPTAPLYVKVTSTDITSIPPDTFARIANVNDVSQLPRDRVVAQRQGYTQYLTTAVTMLYDNVTTADAAALQILDRLSALVNEWRSFSTEFATNPYQDYNLPTTGSSVEAARTAVYVEKRDARVAAEAARDEAQVAKEKCERDCAADKTVYDFLVYDVAFLNQARSIVSGLPSSAARDFVLQQGAYSSDFASYEALLLKKRSDLATYADRVRNCTATCAALASALLAAQQAVDAAAAAERAALASVVAVCPTFDPSTV